MWVPLILFIHISSAEFWMSVDLMSIEWRESCSINAQCSLPRFEILSAMRTVKEETTSQSWPINENFKKEPARSIISYWSSGETDDVTLTCHIVGTDPKYHFPRVCDQTASIHVFQEHIVSAFKLKTTPSSSSSDETEDKTLIEVRGQCFTAMLAIQKHTERCPWCNEPEPFPLVMSDDADLLQILMILFAIVALLVSIAFGILIVLYIREKNKTKKCNDSISDPPYYIHVDPRQRVGSMRQEELRIALPIDGARFLRDWVESSHGTMRTTPNSSRSASLISNMYLSPVPSVVDKNHYEKISSTIALNRVDSGVASSCSPQSENSISLFG